MSNEGKKDETVGTEGRKSLVPSVGYIKAFLLYRTVKCRACGRTLRSEDSIRRGFGPGCAILFGEKWITSHPTYLSPVAVKKWTADEIKDLVKFVANAKKEKRS